MNGGSFMNGKLFSIMVFYIVGSFIILVFGFIILMNFSKDGRLFAHPVVAVEADTSGTKVTEINQADNNDDDVKTLKYKRAADAKGSGEDFGEDLPKTKKFSDTSTGGIKIKVEIVNYTGLKNIPEEIKTTLEAAGFEASIVNYKANKNEKTTLIERSNKKAGAEVQKVLNVGKILTEVDTKAKFDVTLIIGEDYKP